MHKINSFSPFSVMVIKGDILILASELAPPLLVKIYTVDTGYKVTAYKVKSVIKLLS